VFVRRVLRHIAIAADFFEGIVVALQFFGGNLPGVFHHVRGVVDGGGGFDVGCGECLDAVARRSRRQFQDALGQGVVRIEFAVLVHQKVDFLLEVAVPKGHVIQRGPRIDLAAIIIVVFVFAAALPVGRCVGG